MTTRLVLTIAAAFVFSGLCACASSEKGKETRYGFKADLFKNDAETVASMVFNGFRLGGMRSLARRLSDTEGLGANLATELSLRKERYASASGAEKATLLEEMTEDGTKAIVLGDEFTWRDGITYLWLGGDNHGAIAWREFLRGLDKEERGELDPKGGQWFFAEDNQGGKVEVLVRKGKDGKYYVDNMRGQNLPDDRGRLFSVTH